ncbi:hypothetical protein BJ742DRAFT_839647 [Cladochytrium replicatum]|nr:hypothetical protein BJ742DRAFT_839647 [Cladochytrium replicatum]
MYSQSTWDSRFEFGEFKTQLKPNPTITYQDKPHWENTHKSKTNKMSLNSPTSNLNIASLRNRYDTELQMLQTRLAQLSKEYHNMLDTFTAHQKQTVPTAHPSPPRSPADNAFDYITVYERELSQLHQRLTQLTIERELLPDAPTTRDESPFEDGVYHVDGVSADQNAKNGDHWNHKNQSTLNHSSTSPQRHNHHTHSHYLHHLSNTAITVQPHLERKMLSLSISN